MLVHYLNIGGHPVYDLLRNDDRMVLQKYSNRDDVIGMRIHGLLGDGVKASTIISRMIGNRKFVVLYTYPDANRRGLVRDLFSGLVDKGHIIGLFFTTCDSVGEMLDVHRKFFSDLGIREVIDFSLGLEIKRETGVAYLGFDNLPRKERKISLFRYSGFHKHYPGRHIPEGDWLAIEYFLLNRGFDVYLYGYDDVMATNVLPSKDYRKRLTVLDTLKYSSDSSLVISTTTFFPLYHHHWIPCLVLCDGGDVPNLISWWRSNENYIVIDTRTDYKSYIFRYIEYLQRD